LKVALAINPRDTLANRALAVFYMTSKRMAEAEPYVKAATLTVTARRNLCWLTTTRNRKRDDEARSVLIPLANADDTFAEASTRLAEIECAAGPQGRGLCAPGRCAEAVCKEPPRADAPRRTAARRQEVGGGRQRSGVRGEGGAIITAATPPARRGHISAPVHSTRQSRVPERTEARADPRAGLSTSSPGCT